VADLASPPGRATALHQLPPSEHEGAAAARDSQVAHRAGGGGLAKFEMLRGVLRKQGVAGLRSRTDPREHARRIIEELRSKHEFTHESGKKHDSTIGVILTNTRVKFVIPGSPGMRPVSGKR
jgi:hypothetical protein